MSPILLLSNLLLLWKRLLLTLTVHCWEAILINLGLELSIHLKKGLVGKWLEEYLLLLMVNLVLSVVSQLTLFLVKQQVVQGE